MSRVCPDDGTELNPEQFQDVNLDVCPKCAGMFFDDEEIDRLKLLGGDAFAKVEDTNTPVVAPASPEGHRICPGCGHAMHTYRYLYTTPVVLNSCDTCGGLWIEHGELKEMQHWLMEASKADDKLEKKALARELVAEMEANEEGQVAKAQGVERFFKGLMHGMPPYFSFGSDWRGFGTG
jgi:Zn-finger nucleic acid-binding protein